MAKWEIIEDNKFKKGNGGKTAATRAVTTKNTKNNPKMLSEVTVVEPKTVTKNKPVIQKPNLAPYYVPAQDASKVNTSVNERQVIDNQPTQTLEPTPDPTPLINLSNANSYNIPNLTGSDSLYYGSPYKNGEIADKKLWNENKKAEQEKWNKTIRTVIDIGQTAGNIMELWPPTAIGGFVLNAGLTVPSVAMNHHDKNYVGIGADVAGLVPSSLLPGGYGTAKTIGEIGYNAYNVYDDVKDIGKQKDTYQQYKKIPINQNFKQTGGKAAASRTVPAKRTAVKAAATPNNLTIITPEQKEKAQADYDEAYKWTSDYMNSPMYKKMLTESSANTREFDNIDKTRWSNFKSIPPLQILPQPRNEPNTGGTSLGFNGQVQLFPYGFGAKAIYPHELSHSTDRPVEESDSRIIPQSDKNYISQHVPTTFEDSPMYATNKSFYDLFKKNKPKEYKKEAKDYKKFHINYVGQDTETRARLNAIRQGAQQNNLYDPFKEGVTPELYYDKLKNFKFEKEDKSGADPMYQLKNVYSDEEIIYMLNHISENKKENDGTELNNLPIAKNGLAVGERKILQRSQTQQPVQEKSVFKPIPITVKPQYKSEGDYLNQVYGEDSGVQLPGQSSILRASQDAKPYYDVAKQDYASYKKDFSNQIKEEQEQKTAEQVIEFLKANPSPGGLMDKVNYIKNLSPADRQIIENSYVGTEDYEGAKREYLKNLTATANNNPFSKGFWNYGNINQKAQGVGANLYVDKLGIVNDLLNVPYMMGEMTPGLVNIPYNLSEGNYGEAAMGLAGPLSLALLAPEAKGFFGMANSLLNPLAGIVDANIVKGLGNKVLNNYGRKAFTPVLDNVGVEAFSTFKPNITSSADNVAINISKNLKDLQKAKMSQSLSELSNTGFRNDPNYHLNAFNAKKKDILEHISSPEGRKRIQNYIDNNPHLQDKTVDDIIEDFNKTEFVTERPIFDPNIDNKGNWIIDKQGNKKMFPVNPNSAFNWYINGYKKPSIISVGQNFTPYDAQHILEHEFGHLFQRGNKIKGVDDELEKISLKSTNRLFNIDKLKKYNPFIKKYKDKSISVTEGIYGYKQPFGEGLEKQKNYWTEGTKGMEKAAFAAEIRENLLQRGLIKNRYDKITPELLKKHYELYKNTIGDKYNLRLYDIMNKDLNNFKILSSSLNKLPGVLPYIGYTGAGALTYKALQGQQQKYGGIIEDPMGQWAHPGSVTRIPSNQITMQGVNYPVLGVSDRGHTQMMYPGEDYSFRGKSVTEYPMMGSGGEINFTYAGENHRVYEKESPTGNGKGIEGHIMVNHPTENKKRWDTIDLTKITNGKVKTVAQGVASTKKWHKENPEYANGGKVSNWEIIEDIPKMQLAGKAENEKKALGQIQKKINEGYEAHTQYQKDVLAYAEKVKDSPDFKKLVGDYVTQKCGQEGGLSCISTATKLLEGAGYPLGKGYYRNPILQADVFSGKLPGYTYTNDMSSLEPGDLVQLTGESWYIPGNERAPHHMMPVISVNKNGDSTTQFKWFGSQGPTASIDYHESPTYSNSTPLEYEILKKQFVDPALITTRDSLKNEIKKIDPTFDQPSKFKPRYTDYNKDQSFTYNPANYDANNPLDVYHRYITKETYKPLINNKEELMKKYNIDNSEFNQLVKILEGIGEQETKNGLSPRYGIKQIPGTQTLAKLYKGDIKGALDPGQYSEGPWQTKGDYVPKTDYERGSIDEAFATLVDRYKTQVPNKYKKTDYGYGIAVNKYKGMDSEKNDYVKNVLNYSKDLQVDGEKNVGYDDYLISKEKENPVKNPFQLGNYKPELQTYAPAQDNTKANTPIINKSTVAPKMAVQKPGQSVALPPQFQKGGKTNIPIYVNDPKDPRLQMYSDSLSNYNKNEIFFKDYQPLTPAIAEQIKTSYQSGLVYKKRNNPNLPGYDVVYKNIVKKPTQPYILKLQDHAQEQINMPTMGNINSSQQIAQQISQPIINIPTVIPPKKDYVTIKTGSSYRNPETGAFQQKSFKIDKGTGKKVSEETFKNGGKTKKSSWQIIEY